MSGDKRLSTSGVLIATWGVLGVLALLGNAMYRLAPLAWEPLENGMLSGWVLGLYIFSVVFNAYAEGYRGFHKAYSPRVVARAIHLGHHPKPLHVLLAPVFCMALFHATRKRLIISWTLLVAIVAVVILIRQLAQPWRGIVDAGVVVGLGWGSLSIIVLYLRAVFRGEVPEHDSLPEQG